MNIFTLLIKTRFFADSIKKNPAKLSHYVIDYADYSTFILEQTGQYRYRQFNSCILGQENPDKFTQLLMACDNSHAFYCNEKSLYIPECEMKQAFKQPEEYSIVLYNCYQ